MQDAGARRVSIAEGIRRLVRKHDCALPAQYTKHSNGAEALIFLVVELELGLGVVSVVRVSVRVRVRVRHSDEQRRTQPPEQGA